MIKKLYLILISMSLLIINYGCATNVLVKQKLPSEYATQLNIKHYDISYKPDISIPEKLKNILNQKFAAKISEINKNKPNKFVYFSVEINKVNIASKGATLLAGAFVGNNSLHGSVTIFDFETNSIIGEYRIEADRNYGGYSAFFDLEDKIAEEFSTQVLRQLSNNE